MLSDGFGVAVGVVMVGTGCGVAVAVPRLLFSVGPEASVGCAAVWPTGLQQDDLGEGRGKRVPSVVFVLVGYVCRVVWMAMWWGVGVHGLMIGATCLTLTYGAGVVSYRPWCVAGDTAAEIFSSLLGEAERTLRELFRRAREASPAVVFLDEIDAIVAGRSDTGGDGVWATCVQLYQCPCHVVWWSLFALSRVTSVVGVVCRSVDAWCHRHTPHRNGRRVQCWSSHGCGCHQPS